MGNILKLLSIILIFAFALILFIPSTTALATEVKQTEAQQLSNKIKQAAPNSNIATINNNGKLIDLKKNAEGKVYVTEHNSDKPLINPNEVHTNSCNFWVEALIMTIGIVVFVALALTGVGTVLEFMVETLELAWAYLDAFLLTSGVLGGWSILFLAQWIAAKACGTAVPKADDSNKHHWDEMPKQGNSIPV